MCLLLPSACIAVRVLILPLSDAPDPFKCRALVKDGWWLDSSSGQRPAAEQWQPPGCLLHEYSSQDISACLQSQRILLVGDSTVRQIFWALVKKFDANHAKKAIQEADAHSNLNYTSGDLLIEFTWDPYVNSTTLQRELMASEKETGADRDGNTNKNRPAITFIGGGLWYARHGHVNPLREFKDAIDNIIPFINVKSTKTTFPASDSSSIVERNANLLYLAPVQVPWYESLSLERRRTITPAKINTMNEYLQQLSEYQGANILWSYYHMTDKRKSAYAESGLHVTESVATKKADVLLNLKCNARAAAYPFDRTCCSNYQKPVWSQWLILFAGVLILPAVSWVNGKSIFRRDELEDSILAARNERSQVRLLSMTKLLHALLVFILPLCLSFYADRTQFFNKMHKMYSPGEFMTFCIITLVIGALFIRPASTARSDAPCRQQQLPSDAPFLCRDQTDEWKGWMQFLILIYHYTGASKVLWIYQLVRVLVASYLFMTGFGHCVYFYEKRDYSLRRVAAVLVRLNLLSCLLPYMMRTDYLSYYFASLVSFWFLVVYATMKIGHTRNDSLPFLLGKIITSAAIVTLLTKSTGTLEAIFATLGAICRIHWSAKEWRFRLGLDIYIVYTGMLTAILFVNLNSKGRSRHFEDVVGILRKHFGTLRVASVGLSMIVLPTYLLATRHFANKYDYNRWHPYLSFLPILSFVVLRNAHSRLRNLYSRSFAWLGKYSLETFTLQFHIWLAGDTKGLLSIGFYNRDGTQPVGKWLESAVLTVIFIWISWCVGEATGVLTRWIVDGGEIRKSTALGGLVEEAGRISPELSTMHIREDPTSMGDFHATASGMRSRGVTGRWKVGPLQILRDHLSARLGMMLFFMWFLNVVSHTLGLEQPLLIISDRPTPDVETSRLQHLLSICHTSRLPYLLHVSLNLNSIAWRLNIVGFE